MTDDKAYFRKIAADKHELLHIKYLKWCLGVHKKASNIGVFGDTARLPLIVILDATKLSCDYFLRCKDLDDSLLTKKAYIEQKTLNLDWYRSMNSCLQNYNRGNSKVASVNVFSNLRSIFVNKWENSVRTSPKLEFYSTIKTKFSREAYLSIPTFKYRSALTRLRISAHDLEIERGRYQSNSTKSDTDNKENKKASYKSKEERTCRYCLEILQTTTTECEKHVLDDCLLYLKHRLKFLQNTSTSMNFTSKCTTQIMQELDIFFYFF